MTDDLTLIQKILRNQTEVSTDLEALKQKERQPSSKDQEFNLLLKGFEGKEVLVVLRDKAGNEYYSKVFLSATQQYIAALDPERTLKPGEYLVTASSNNKIYSKKIKVR